MRTGLAARIRQEVGAGNRKRRVVLMARLRSSAGILIAGLLGLGLLGRRISSLGLLGLV